MNEPGTVFPVGPKDRGKRLDRFLHERIPRLSRSRIQQAIRRRVTLSWGGSPRPATRVRPGGDVHVGYDRIDEEPLDLSIPVIARGDGWLAIDKPSGVPVHPVNRVRENSLIRLLRRQEGDEHLRLVHRLDRETSGVLLIAGTRDASRAIATAFERGRVHKEYLALVHGAVDGDQGVVTLPIRDARGSRVHVRLEAADVGKAAETGWRVERRLDDRTLLRVLPRTGRRHQIRVHLAAIGHPVVGDPLYGRPDEDYLAMVRGVRDARAEEGGPLRHLLHCARVVFPDPSGAGALDVSAPLPADFRQALASRR